MSNLDPLPRRQSLQKLPLQSSNPQTHGNQNQCVITENGGLSFEPSNRPPQHIRFIDKPVFFEKRAVGIEHNPNIRRLQATLKPRIRNVTSPAPSEPQRQERIKHCTRKIPRLLQPPKVPGRVQLPPRRINHERPDRPRGKRETVLRQFVPNQLQSEPQHGRRVQIDHGLSSTNHRLHPLIPHPMRRRYQPLRLEQVRTTNIGKRGLLTCHFNPSNSVRGERSIRHRSTISSTLSAGSC